MTYKEFREIIKDKKKQLACLRIKVRGEKETLLIKGKRTTLFKISLSSPADPKRLKNGIPVGAGLEHSFLSTETTPILINDLLCAFVDLVGKSFVWGVPGKITTPGELK